MLATRICAAVLGAALALMAVGACSDERTREGRSEHAAITGKGPQGSRACQDCVLAGKSACRAAYDACVTNVKCSRMAICEFERGCLATAARDQQCLRICSKGAGIRSLTDPAFLLAWQLNVAASVHCGPACRAD
jgi:hypothetical protein